MKAILQHQHRRIRQVQPTLQQAIAGADAADENRDRSRDGVVPVTGNQNSGIAVARDE